MPEAVARASELLAPRLAGGRQERHAKRRSQMVGGRTRRQLPETVEPPHQMVAEQRPLAHRGKVPRPDPKRNRGRTALEERRDRGPRCPPDPRDVPGGGGPSEL